MISEYIADPEDLDAESRFDLEGLAVGDVLGLITRNSEYILTVTSLGPLRVTVASSNRKFPYYVEEMAVGAAVAGYGSYTVSRAGVIIHGARLGFCATSDGELVWTISEVQHIKRNDQLIF